MSLTHNHNDFEITESLAVPRVLDHDDFEDNPSVAGPVTDSEIPSFMGHVGLGDVQHMPVSLSYPIYSLLLFTDKYHPRCRESNAHVVPRGASSSGCFQGSIALAAINPARLSQVRDSSSLKRSTADI